MQTRKSTRTSSGMSKKRERAQTTEDLFGDEEDGDEEDGDEEDGDEEDPGRRNSNLTYRYIRSILRSDNCYQRKKVLWVDNKIKNMIILNLWSTNGTDSVSGDGDGYGYKSNPHIKLLQDEHANGLALGRNMIQLLIDKGGGASDSDVACIECMINYPPCRWAVLDSTNRELAYFTMVLREKELEFDNLSEITYMNFGTWRCQLFIQNKGPCGQEKKNGYNMLLYLLLNVDRLLADLKCITSNFNACSVNQGYELRDALTENKYDLMQKFLNSYRSNILKTLAKYIGIYNVDHTDSNKAKYCIHLGPNRLYKNLETGSDRKYFTAQQRTTPTKFTGVLMPPLNIFDKIWRINNITHQQVEVQRVEKAMQVLNITLTARDLLVQSENGEYLHNNSIAKITDYITKNEDESFTFANTISGLNLIVGRSVGGLKGGESYALLCKNIAILKDVIGNKNINDLIENADKRATVTKELFEKHPTEFANDAAVLTVLRAYYSQLMKKIGFQPASRAVRVYFKKDTTDVVYIDFSSRGDATKILKCEPSTVYQNAKINGNVPDSLPPLENIKKWSIKSARCQEVFFSSWAAVFIDKK